MIMGQVISSLLPAMTEQVPRPESEELHNLFGDDRLIWTVIFIFLLLLLGSASIVFLTGRLLSPRTSSQNSKKTKELKDDTVYDSDPVKNAAMRRKMDFLERTKRRNKRNNNDDDPDDNFVYDYGYASSPAGFIDRWRALELPGLIHPIQMDHFRPTHETLIKRYLHHLQRETRAKMAMLLSWIADAATAILNSMDDNTTMATSKKNADSENHSLEEPEVYLDYAGAALPTRSQLAALYANASSSSSASSTILANPHSSGPAAARTQRLMEQSRKRILDFLDAQPGVRRRSRTSSSNANQRNGKGTPNQQKQNRDSNRSQDHADNDGHVNGVFDQKQSIVDNDDNDDGFHPGYDLIFTSGATEAFRIVAEHFAWSSASSTSSLSSSCFIYPQQSHTSVVGMRACAMAAGARVLCRSQEEIMCQLSSSALDPPGTDAEHFDMKELPQHLCHIDSATTNHLIVLPVECNFGGNRPTRLAAVLRNFQKRQKCSNSTQSNEPNSSSGINRHRHHRVAVMLDIAKAANTSPLSLRQLDPDFACLSFYKLFGEPTGLGCLLVKRSSMDLLTRVRRTQFNGCNGGGDNGVRHGDTFFAVGGESSSRAASELKSRRQQQHSCSYFGGGSVDILLPKSDFCILRSSTPLASLTHGTIHFRGIVALEEGFNIIDKLGGMSAIRRHTSSLAQELVRRLRQLQHDNGKPVVEIYGDWGKFDCSANNFSVEDLPGPTVAFNILRRDGDVVGYNEVTKLAALNRPPIQLRSGCFCNPGACQVALGLSDDDVLKNYLEGGHVCGDEVDLVNGRPTGAIRASFGKDSIWEDLDALVTFVERLFVSKAADVNNEQRRWNDGKPRNVVLSEIYLFPIKSCAAQRVQRWRLESSGLKLAFDREFALVDASGTAMRLQQFPKMAFIEPVVNDEAKTMVVSAPNFPDLLLDLVDEAPYAADSGSPESIVKVCGDSCSGVLWGSFQASEWFSDYLGVQCWLARHSTKGNYDVPMIKDGNVRPERPIRRKADIGFANDQPLLLISEHAVAALNKVLSSREKRFVSSRHFRPNLVVRIADDGDWVEPGHTEDAWTQLTLTDRNITFEAVGPCARCSMVDVDPSTGMKNGEALRALAEYRRKNGHILFGIFLRGASTHELDDVGPFIEEGDLIYCE